ncbi:MAG: hypothetical protein M3258_07810 [Thermoproteota archaeon]|nr:hypothetical protein [Thermoproteota archaeon]
MNVAVIGCIALDIISACHITISSLAKEGHKIYAIITTEETSQSSSSLSSSSEIANAQKVLAEIGIADTFVIDEFDYSAITQTNADAVRMFIKDVKPSLVIIPFWKSPNHMRRILARTSLIACRGIGSILMYELEANNTCFNPNIVFRISEKSAPSLGHTGNTLEHGNTIDCQVRIDTNTLTNRSMLLQDKGVVESKSNSSYEVLEEKFESHRTLLLEEEGLI